MTEYVSESFWRKSQNGMPIIVFFKYRSSLEVQNTARQLYGTVLVTTDELMMRKSNLFFASKSLNDTDYNKRAPNNINTFE